MFPRYTSIEGNKEVAVVCVHACEVGRGREKRRRLMEQRGREKEEGTE